MSRQEIARAMNTTVSYICQEARRRFDEKARLCGPCVTDAMIWESIHAEFEATAERCLFIAKNMPIWNEQMEAAHLEFEAADRANGWA